MAGSELSGPSLPWRAASRVTITVIGAVSKCYLTLACTTKVVGLDKFSQILDDRRDVAKRDRGLLTVSNHLSVMDEPLIWGVLPFRHLTAPNTMRWSLGSHDICFKTGPNSPISTFFSLGQTLPTHRLAHSPFGGPNQPTITQSIRLLSRGPTTSPTPPHPSWPSPPATPLPPDEYSTTGTDSYPAPSAHASRRHAWLHVFPEGRVHQHPRHGMLPRFKWGAARLLLEAEPAPLVVPVFISGLATVMPEDRAAPRWLPRLGARVEVAFGDPADDRAMDAFRRRWKALRDKVGVGRSVGDGAGAAEVEAALPLEVRELRSEVAGWLREEVAKVRRARGWPEEDETWSGEKKDDGGLVGTT